MPQIPRQRAAAVVKSHLDARAAIAGIVAIHHRPVRGLRLVGLPQVENLIYGQSVAVIIHPMAQDLDRVVPIITSVIDGTRRDRRALARVALLPFTLAVVIAVEHAGTIHPPHRIQRRVRLHNERLAQVKPQA